MLVEFKTPWFAPSDKIVRDKMNTLSGRLYTQGIHEIPDAMKKYLPKNAKIVKNREGDVVEEVAVAETLRDFDDIRTEANAQEMAAEKAASTLKERRQEQMAKARAAKKTKE